MISEIEIQIMHTEPIDATTRLSVLRSMSPLLLMANSTITKSNEDTQAATPKKTTMQSVMVGVLDLFL